MNALTPCCKNCESLIEEACTNSEIINFISLKYFDHEQRISFKPDHEFCCNKFKIKQTKKEAVKALISRQVSHTYIEDLIQRHYGVTYDIPVQERVMDGTLSYPLTERKLDYEENLILNSFKTNENPFLALRVLLQDMVTNRVLPPREYNVVITK